MGVGAVQSEMGLGAVQKGVEEAGNEVKQPVG